MRPATARDCQGRAWLLSPTGRDVIQEAGYYRPTEIEAARPGRSPPLEHESVVGKPRLTAFLMDLPLPDQVLGCLIVW